MHRPLYGFGLWALGAAEALSLKPEAWSRKPARGNLPRPAITGIATTELHGQRQTRRDSDFSEQHGQLVSDCLLTDAECPRDRLVGVTSQDFDHEHPLTPRERQGRTGRMLH